MNEFHDLETILNIPDPQKRFQELKALAGDLGALVGLNKVHRSGEYNEQQLVVAIYDAILSQQNDNKRNTRFLLLFSVGGILALFLVFFLPRAAMNYFRVIYAKNNPRQKAYKGVDDKGKVVRDENDQPVLFHDMEGPYDEYYDDGQLHFEYIYHNGKVLQQKEFSREGRLISYIKYDAEGNPILMNFSER